jgi:Fe2+ transport system protein FeoA
MKMFRSIWKSQVNNKDINLGITQSKKDINSSNHFIYLSELECGKSAKVAKIQGDPALMDKLRAMGIYEGTIILKKGAIPAKGPVIVEKGTMQFALGYDIAEKILVECL